VTVFIGQLPSAGLAAHELAEHRAFVCVCGGCPDRDALLAERRPGRADPE
jgi:hypothetical protein